MIRGAPIILLLLAGAPAAQDRVAVYEDSYGYARSFSSDPTCASHFIDIEGSGDLLTLIRDDASGDPLDDGVAVVPLTLPLDFYGTPTQTIRVSSNGYLALSDQDADDGEDFSNDCPLPAVPGNDRASGARAMVLHDDLSGNAQSASITHRYFAVCPRVSGTGLASSCTVIQWSNWQLSDQSPATFQAVLYHDTADIVFQYVDVPNNAFESGSVGLQNRGATSAARASCNHIEPLAGVDAVCFYEPRYPAAALPPTIFADGFE